MDEESLPKYFQEKMKFYASQSANKLEENFNYFEKIEREKSDLESRLISLLGHKPEDAAILTFYIYYNHAHQSPPEWLRYKEKLQKYIHLRNRITELLPLLEQLYSDEGIFTRAKQVKELLSGEKSKSGFAVYSHIALSSLLAYIPTHIEDNIDDDWHTNSSGRGRKSQSVEKYTRRLLLAVIYDELNKTYLIDDGLTKREREGLLRVRARDILIKFGITIPGISLRTKGDRDRFQIELKEGLRIKENEYAEFYSNTVVQKSTFISD